MPVTQNPKEPIWQFALDIYARPGVADDCLRAQDEFGLNVVPLIFALFRASQNRGFPADDAHILADSFAVTTIEPLRRARRSLKPAPAALNADEAEGLRTLVKASELEAERLCLVALERLDDTDLPLGAEESLARMVKASGLHLSGELASLLKRLSHAVETPSNPN